MIAATLLNLYTMSDALFYLGLQRNLDFEVGVFPLLFVGTALVYMLLAVPVGKLADRVGKTPVLVGRYLMLVPVYCALLFTSLLVLGWVPNRAWDVVCRQRRGACCVCQLAAA